MLVFSPLDFALFKQRVSVGNHFNLSTENHKQAHEIPVLSKEVQFFAELYVYIQRSNTEGMLKPFVDRLFSWVLKPATYNSDQQTTILLNCVSTGAT